MAEQLRTALAYLTSRKQNPNPKDLEILNMDPAKVSRDSMRERAEEVLLSCLNDMQDRIKALEARAVRPDSETTPTDGESGIVSYTE